MTDPSLTLLVLLVDNSSSMLDYQTEMETTLNRFLDDQRVDTEELGCVHVTYSLFNHTYRRVFADKPIGEVRRITLEPNGSTAMLDGIGKVTNEVGASLAALPEDERPDNVILAILTDGHENASRRYTKSDIKAIIEEQQNVYNWTILFLAANMDAVAEADAYGIDRGQSLSWDTGGEAIANAGAALSNYVTRSRKMSVKGISSHSVAFTEQERDAAVKEG